MSSPKTANFNLGKEERSYVFAHLLALQMNTAPESTTLILFFNTEAVQVTSKNQSVMQNYWEELLKPSDRPVNCPVSGPEHIKIQQYHDESTKTDLGGK